jgi:hypothetical protein
MNRALADDTLRTKLGEFVAQTELYDKDGRVIGVFTPAIDSDRRWYEWAKRRHTEKDEAELDRMCNEAGEKTTEEVLKSLRAP